MVTKIKLLYLVTPVDDNFTTPFSILQSTCFPDSPEQKKKMVTEKNAHESFFLNQYYFYLKKIF